MRTFRCAVLVVALLFALPATAIAATSAGQPFPSDLFTAADASQLTGRRVDLPKPDCAARPSDCADIDVLNTLDGFNVQPRISVPFTGPIDLVTVSSDTIFIVGPEGHVGINQAVWEPATNTLHFESDEQLAPDSTYLLVLTNGVHAANGTPIDATFRHDLNFGQTKDPAVKAYRKALLGALETAVANPDDVATASLFTTQSIGAISRKIRAQLTGGEATFTLGSLGERTVFPFATVLGIQFRRQTGTAPTFSTSTLPGAVPVFPGALGMLAFGSYRSPDYETQAKVIPAYGTKTGTPEAQGVNDVQFALWVPSGAKPAGGWPVAIFGHGFTDNKLGAPLAVASSLAHAGIATIAINVVGHGGGPLGTYTVLRAGGLPVTLPAGGRGIDPDGNETIDSTEGVNAAPPRALIGNRDALRQTTIDLMQLVKVLEGGVDVDSDGATDLSTSRVYYAGQSFGGIYGTQLLALEPDIRAGVPNVPGGPIIEIARLSPSFRSLVGLALLNRVPSLYNGPPDPTLQSFVENIPLRNQPIVTDTAPGASAIQEYIDHAEWAQQAGNPAAYAPDVTTPVIYQFARGDKTVPNPTTSAILRACGCASRATLFRNDIAFATVPGYTVKNPHTFLTNLAGVSALFAVQAQGQIATFFASDGATTVDPDGGQPYFETPTSIVPEDLAFIP